MKIKVLGPGCRNCQKLEKNTVAALSEIGQQAEIEKVTDFAEIAGYGVMKTPGLVIDDEVVGTGVGRTKKDAEQQAAERAYTALSADSVTAD